MSCWARTASNKTKRELPHYCDKCKRGDVFLEYHHIIPYNVFPCSNKWNIVQLCHDCHVETHRLYRNMKYDEFLSFIEYKLPPVITWFMDEDERQEYDELTSAIYRLQHYRREKRWWIRDRSYAAQAIADINTFRYGYMAERN